MALHWSPPVELSPAEIFVIKRCGKRKLFVFLRHHRRDIFDEDTQARLAQSYGPRRRGEEPVPPAQLALAVLLQAAFHVPDHEVPELLVMDRRWQMVLDCMNREEPPFSQTTFFRFRQRMIEHGLDKILFDRTVALAKKTGAFGAAQLRAAFDACPLYGTGRVEDSFNLIGRAAFHVVRTAAERLGHSLEEVAAAAGIPVVAASSIKAGLDIDWDDTHARRDGLRALLAQIDALQVWLQRELGAAIQQPPLRDQLKILKQLIEQDTDPDPHGGGPTLKQGVAPDRIISLGDKEMRHGRKSKARRFDGYKRHIAIDIDAPQFIVAITVTPANQPERVAAASLVDQVEAHGRVLKEIHIDRGYLGADAIEERRGRGAVVISKPFPLHNRGLYTKADFVLDQEKSSVTCPNGIEVPFQLGTVIHFPDASCSTCALRSACQRGRGRGRSLSIHRHEDFLIELRAARKTREGRQRARARIHVEHGLARLVTRSGQRARYRGLRKNLFDQRRHAAVVNLRALASAPLTGSAL